MPEMYNLRSSQRKSNCYLQNYIGNDSPEAYNPRVCLKRSKLLDCRDFHNSRFYLERDRIKIKKEGDKMWSKKNFIKVASSIILFLLFLFYCRDEIQFYRVKLTQKFTELQPTVHGCNYKAEIVYNNFVKTINNLMQTIKNEQTEPEFIVAEKKYALESIEDDMDIGKLVRDNLKVERKNEMKNFTKMFTSFIEEQCQINEKDKFNKFFGEDDLTDYAMESSGAEIVTTFDTEPYGNVTVKLFNFNIWRPLSRFIMSRSKYFSTNEPNSILRPWRKPGDCWAFKGSRGKVQIKLSEKIFITAITVDHIPKTALFDGNIKSAPKKFSLTGVKEPGTLFGGMHLGTFEYRNTGGASQTFSLRKDSKIPFEWIQLNIESNHGSNYTCIYKIRVHGHK